MNTTKIKFKITIALFFFLISALYGLLMRIQKVYPILTVKYTNILQAHSHVTFLGWGFLSVGLLILYAFIDREKTVKVWKYLAVLNISFWIMVIALIGMLISFPIQGYKLFSILFLTLFLLTSYVFLYIIYSNIKNRKIVSVYFIKAGIGYYYLSSMGIWALSIITVKIGKGDWYQHAISFYTHFLYNGFFVLILFGLFFKVLDNKSFNIQEKWIKWFYYLINGTVIPTFALSILWVKVPNYIIIIGFLGAFIQLISLLFLYKIFQKLTIHNLKVLWIFRFIFYAFSLKVVIQLIGSSPDVTKLALLYKPYFVIGYIHMFTLAFMSMFIFFLSQNILNHKINKLGLYLFASGVFISEILLFMQGILLYFQEKTISNFNELLLMASILMPLGIIIIIFRLKRLLV